MEFETRSKHRSTEPSSYPGMVAVASSDEAALETARLPRSASQSALPRRASAGTLGSSGLLQGFPGRALDLRGHHIPIAALADPSSTATNRSNEAARRTARLTRSSSDPGRARSPWQIGTSGALGASGILGAAPTRIADGSSLSSVDTATTIYDSASSGSSLRRAPELDEDLDGYVTAPDSDGEWESESNDSTTVRSGSHRRSSDPEIIPAREEALQAANARSTPAAAVAPAPAGLWARRAEAYGPAASLMDALSCLVATVGWILYRQAPMVMTVGTGLADTLHFTFAALDAHHKGSQLKATGKGLSAVTRAIASQVPIVRDKHPQNLAAVNAMRIAAWTVSGVGRSLVAIDARNNARPASATGQFASAAMSVIGVIETALEWARARSNAFLPLQGIVNFYTAVPVAGGAIDNARASKVNQPWRRDPKVLAMELAAFGMGVGNIASTLNQVYTIKDQEEGTHDASQFAPLIATLGAAGWFLATVGCSMFVHMDFRPKPQPDLEAAVELSPIPRSDPGAGPSGADARASSS